MENYLNISKEKCISFFKSIKNKNNFAITAHEDPDGDAIASIYAIAYILKYLKKDFSIYLKNLPPENYMIAPFKINLIDNVKKIKETNIIVVDCSNAQRPFIKELETTPIIANIDHHQDNNNFGKYNLVYPEAPSTAEIIFELLKCFVNNFNIDKNETKNIFNKDLLNSILLGILYDTYYFNTENTNAITFKNVAQIIELGGELHKIKEILFKQKDPVIYKIWGSILNNIELFNKGKIVLAYLDHKDYKKIIKENPINSPSYSMVTEGFINHLTSLKNSDLVIFLREHEGFVKGSVRSSSGQAAKFANIFKGGGHKNAAGFKIKGTLPVAIKIIKTEIKNFEIN